MKLIQSHAEIINEINPMKKIVLAGRTCYKSEKNITEDSAKRFVKALANNKHHAMLEHAVFSFVVDTSILEHIGTLDQYPFFTIDAAWINGIAVTANLRAIHENDSILSYELRSAVAKDYPEIAEVLQWNVGSITTATLADPDTFPEDIKHRHKHLTMRFICDRGVTHELVRHRPCSFAQESTRYVNYANVKNTDPEKWEEYQLKLAAYESSKLSEEIAGLEKPEPPAADILFIEPADFESWSEEQKYILLKGLEYAEDNYLEAIENGLQAQQARALLPNAVKTEIVVTAALSEWSHIMNLRYHGTTGSPHPDMKCLMTKAYPLYEAAMAEQSKQD